jgi:fimbrial chaperone protein
VDAQRELSYRLILTEVPSSAEPGFSGLTVALRLSLPVFIAPQAPAEADLQWTASRSVDGHLALTARNAGEAHVRLLNFSLAPVSGSAPALEKSAAAYVLPGQARTWVFDQVGPDQLASADWRTLRLSGLAANGPVAAEISLVAD